MPWPKLSRRERAVPVLVGSLGVVAGLSAGQEWLYSALLVLAAVIGWRGLRSP